MNNVKNQIRKLKEKEKILVSRRQKLEEIDYYQNQENRMKALVGKFFVEKREYDYQRYGYGRLLSCTWEIENGKKYLKLITECFREFSWGVEIQRSSMTDFHPEFDDFAEKWKEVSKEKYVAAKKEIIANLKQ